MNENKNNLLKPVQMGEGKIAAIKVISRYSHTISMMGLFICFCFAIHPFYRDIEQFPEN